MSSSIALELTDIFLFSLNLGFSFTWWILPFCCCSVTQSCLTLCDPVDCSTPGFPVLHRLPFTNMYKWEFVPSHVCLEFVCLFVPTHVHWINDAIQLSPSLSPLLLLPSVFPSIRVFSSESALHIRWPKYWSFSFSISLSNEYSGLISFRIDWFDLLALQGTLKSLLQHHSLKSSILRCSAFFMVQLLHLYMTTGKAVDLTIWIFVGKMMPLLFNTLYRFVIVFLLRSKHLLISWLQSPSAVILEPRKIKSLIVSPSICHEVMGPDAMILVFWMLSLKPAFSLSSPCTKLFNSLYCSSSSLPLTNVCWMPSLCWLLHRHWGSSDEQGRHGPWPHEAWGLPRWC